ncbi:hypothetical protein WH8501_07425 [Crocosphaera watsonii WH 8501]|uniref:hypothetical protein n=1 Tax=Crocosphaera watsonii TaxID=263511 RepID=UPI000039CAA1|nr:hypothetical protein [Crocosphaera watsonii]
MLFLRRNSTYSQDKLEEELLKPHKSYELESQAQGNKELDTTWTLDKKSLLAYILR